MCGLGLTLEDLGTGQSSRSHYIKAVTLISFLNYNVFFTEDLLLHGVSYNSLFLGVKSLEHESIAHLLMDGLLDLIRLRNDLRNEGLLLVPGAENFSRDRLPRTPSLLFSYLLRQDIDYIIIFTLLSLIF